MDDSHEDLIRRAAELADCSWRARSIAAELKAESEELACQLAKTRKSGTRVMQELREQRSALAAVTGKRGAHPGSTGPERATALNPSSDSRRPGTPGGNLAGEAPLTRLGPGADMLDQDEAVTLAALLEELAARHRPGPLSAPALRAAALLRQRAAARRGQAIRPGAGGPAARREAGDIRDDDADNRDAQAEHRDRSADERDDRAKERDRQADDADQQARASERHLGDLLWVAQMRDNAAAEHAAAPLSARDDAMRRQWQLDREMAEANRARNQEDRQAIQEMLSQAGAARQAARHGRYAEGQDRLASHRDRDAARADRRAAARDRQAARADRDQAVVESEEEDVLPGIDLA